MQDVEGELCFTRSDGELLRVGKVRGADGRDAPPARDGVDGEPGPPGRGIVDTYVTEEGRLYFAYSDKTEETLSNIKGPRGEPGPKGDPGADGIDADPAFVRSLVVEAISAIPVPRDGVDGAHGRGDQDG